MNAMFRLSVSVLQVYGLIFWAHKGLIPCRKRLLPLVPKTLLVKDEVRRFYLRFDQDEVTFHEGLSVKFTVFLVFLMNRVEVKLSY